MLAQLPEEKRDLIKPLFQKKQPNNSALWCYFDGKMTGKTFVDDITSPTKAICRLDMSWTYINDDADLPWIEDVLGEVIKKDWLQVIWVPERKGTYPLKEFSKIIPRFEFIERKEAFLEKAFGFYAVENGEVCSESEAAFTAHGFTEIGIYTFEPYRKRGFAFATCLKTLEELEKMGLKAI